MPVTETTPSQSADAGSRVKTSIKWLLGSSDPEGGLQAIKNRTKRGTPSSPETVIIDIPIPVVEKNVANDAWDIESDTMFEFTDGGHFDLSAGGKILFHGKGDAKPTDVIPHYKNAQATYTIEDEIVTARTASIRYADDAVGVPEAVSTELFADDDTDKNNSYSEKLALADALMASRSARIEIAPGRDLAGRQVYLLENRHIVWKNGRHENSFDMAAAGGRPIIFGANTVFEGERLAEIMVSSTDGSEPIFRAESDGFIENVHWKNLQFTGQGAASTNGGSIIHTGNIVGGSVTGCRGKNLKDYFVTIGWDTVGGAWAEDFTVYDFRAKDCATSTLNIISGVNIEMEKIRLKYGASAFQSVASFAGSDVEPNKVFGRVANLTYRNWEIVIDEDNPNILYAIMIQATSAGGIKKVLLENVIVNSKPVNTNIGAQYGVWAKGVEDLTIRSFDMKGGAYNRTIFISQSDTVTIDSASESGGVNSIRLQGVSNATVLDCRSENAYPVIEESNFYHHVLGLGDAIEPLERHSPDSGRIYNHYTGKTLDTGAAEVEILDVETDRTETWENHPFYEITVDGDFGTIAAKTFTAANVSGDVITITNHGFGNCEPLSLSSSGAMPTDWHKRVYAIRIDANSFKLTTTLDNAIAGNAYPITGGSGTFTLQPFNLTVSYFSPSDVDTSLDRIYLPLHRYQTGQLVYYDAATAIGGLTKGTASDEGSREDGMYYLIVSGSYVQLAATKALALAGTAINLTNQGAGAQLFYPSAKYVGTKPNRFIANDHAIVAAPLSGAKVYPRFGLDSTLGALPAPDGEYIQTTDTLGQILAKLAALNPLPSLQQFNFGGQINSVSGWTDIAFENAFYGTGGDDFYYPSETPSGSPANAVTDLQIIKSIIYMNNSDRSWTIPNLQAGADYTARFHIWVPVTFVGAGQTNAWGITIDGASVGTISTTSGTYYTVDCDFTAAGSTAEVVFTANTTGSYKAVSAAEVIKL